MMISKEGTCKTFCKHGYHCLQTDISLDNLNCQFFRGADNTGFVLVVFGKKI